MVTVRYLVWQCETCKREFMSGRTPKEAQVFCEGPDHQQKMKLTKEVYL